MVAPAGVKCGIWTYSAYLCEALQKLGVGPEVLAEKPYPNEAVLDPDFKPRVPYHFCWSRTEPYTKVIEESKNYDVLHLQHQFGLFPIPQNYIELLQKSKKPLVVTLHDVVPPNPEMQVYFNETFLNASKVIVHTTTCESLLKMWRCPEEKIALIPHGTKLIDVPSKVDARKTLGLPEDAEIILSWGFIWESKGILDMVKIFSEVLKSHPKAMFIHAGGIHPIIAGSSYLKTILVTAIKSGLTPKNFKITQWVPENSVPMWFGASDLIVLNYMRGSASASGAAHRAMASHRPLVGTDDSCLTEVPKYEVTRFSPSELYKGILTVLEDVDLQKELVKKQDEASQKMSWDAVARQHKKVYEEVTG